MAQPQYRDSTKASTEGAMTLDIAYPTFTSGDLAILFCVNDSSANTWTTPAGWSVGHANYQMAGQHDFIWFYKTLTTESGNLTVEWADSAATILVMAAINPNGATITISDEDINDGAANPHTGPTVTGVADCILLVAMAMDSGSAITVPPADMTAMQNKVDLGAGTVAIYTGYELRGAGDVSKSITWGADDSTIGVAVVLADSGGSGGTSILTQLASHQRRRA